MGEEDLALPIKNSSSYSCISYIYNSEEEISFKGLISIEHILYIQLSIESSKYMDSNGKIVNSFHWLKCYFLVQIAFSLEPQWSPSTKLTFSFTHAGLVADVFIFWGLMLKTGRMGQFQIL